MSEVLSLMERAIARADDITFQVTEMIRDLDFVLEETKRLYNAVLQNHPTVMRDSNNNPIMSVDGLVKQFRESETSRKRLESELEIMKEGLKDPAIVHKNMLRGVVSKISAGQFLHLVGEDVPTLKGIKKEIEGIISEIEGEKNE